MDNKPKFSIIIPAYNAGKYISDAIDSVHNQSFKSYEVIVIDDKSTDNTAVIVEEMAIRDSRIRLLRQQNGKGASDARNFGIEQSKGEYLMFLDADDYYINVNLLDYLSRIIKESGPDIIHFGYTESKSRDNEKLKTVEPFSYEELEYEEVVRRTIFMSKEEAEDKSYRAASPCTKAYKSQLVKERNIFFPSGVKNSEDAIFNLRVLRYKPTIKLLKIIGYHYWSNIGNSCQRFMPEFKDDLNWMLQLFENESKPFLSIERVSARIVNRQYSYIDKVLRQYFFHNESTASKLELEQFLQNDKIGSIAHECVSSMLPMSYRIVLWGVRFKSAFLINLGINLIPKIRKLIK